MGIRVGSHIGYCEIATLYESGVNFSKLPVTVQSAIDDMFCDANFVWNPRLNPDTMWWLLEKWSFDEAVAKISEYTGEDETDIDDERVSNYINEHYNFICKYGHDYYFFYE